MASPNFLTSNYIYGRTEQAAVSADGTWFADNPAASGAIKKIEGLYVANTSADPKSFSVSLVRNEVPFPLVPSVTVDGGGTAVVFDSATILFVEDGDYISVSGADELVATCVYQEMGVG